MKRVILPFSAVIIIIVALLFVISVWDYYDSQSLSSVCIREACFNVEVASTPEARAWGLMLRESLAADGGMIFVYNQEGIYQFWMKNTLIPLDIIWISSGRKIVNIKRNAQPCQPDYCPTINPGAESKYVLEINAGLSDEYGFTVGDTVTIDLHQ